MKISALFTKRNKWYSFFILCLLQVGNASAQDTLCNDTILIGNIITANSFAWNTGETTVQINVSTAGVYIRTANLGSTVAIDSFDVIDGQALAHFTYTDSLLSYTFLNTSINADSFLWTFGDGDSSSIKHPVHAYSTTGNYTVCLFAYGNRGACHDTTCQNLSPVGIKEIFNSNLISIYPNPTKDILTLKISQEVDAATIEIQNLLGEAIKSHYMAGNGTKALTMDISDLSSGIYFVKAYNARMTITKRLLVE